MAVSRSRSTEETFFLGPGAVADEERQTGRGGESTGATGVTSEASPGPVAGKLLPGLEMEVWSSDATEEVCVGHSQSTFARQRAQAPISQGAVLSCHELRPTADYLTLSHDDLN